VGWYLEQVVPRLTNVACGVKTVEALRARVCAGLHGEVVELGFGSGLNVPFYPAAVTSVAAVEPSDVGWRLARKRLAASDVPVRRAALDGQDLPFDDGSFDAAVSTWTLCTIPDAGRALTEVRRVLRPGAPLRFVEHGLAPDESVQRWQRRLEPLQKRIAGGCHLTRPISDLLTGAGFDLVDVDVFYEKGAPKAVGACTLGTAISR
jgi:ubiquinone/menaquinone biosynthesis C-methylase UbiE